MRSPDTETTTDEAPLQAKVARARAGQADPLVSIMQAHNQRLFRIARGVLRDDAEAEDVVQDAFVKAFTRADELRDQSKLAPWLARITVNLARDRARQLRRRDRVISFPGELDEAVVDHAAQSESPDSYSPERCAAMGDVRDLVERHIDRLPDGFREVFMLREVEQMSTEETAETLDISPATVKTRLHRAKAQLRKGMERELTAASLRTFPFGGVRCARTTRAVLARLQRETVEPGVRSYH